NVDYDDGPGTTASFYSTQSLAFDPKGNLYVTQVYGRLRKITPAGVVSTVISPGLPNEFHFGVTTDDYSNVYVSLSPAPEEDYIVKISPGGQSKILAGGARGFQDGQGQNAKFNVSQSITMDDKGNMYVADLLNYRIRKISKPELKFSTTAGNPSPEQLVSISGIGVMGNILVTVPPAYEITQTSGSGYASSLSLTPESGEVNMAQIFVRLKANAGYGFHNGHIQLSSPGAKTQKHPLKGFVADNIPPQVECPSSQIFCFSPSNLYHIPLLNVMDAGGIKKISYTITGATNRSGTGTNASGYFNPGINQLKWVVTDLAGNTSTCTTQVKIDYRLNVIIADSYPLLYLGRANTIYKGLGSGCARLYVIVTGGTPFAGSNKYQYLWSNGSTGSHTTVCPSNVGNHQYTVTVTDALGCKITVTKTIEVVDARCGPNNERFLLCLNGNQVCYSGAQALWAIFHGARPGPCNDPVARISTPGDNKKETETIRAFTGIRVFPNPNQGSFNLQWDVTDAKEMTILDVSGKIIQRRSINGTTGLQTMVIDLGPVPSGLYLVIITGKDRQYTSKIIIQ
ncbi:MAG: T9SS type A sorting domain-containing protein, partial [Flavisolibacter sp.]